ncbi:MAG: DegT/DnrJ/EryC1/StrS family aminotransferase [Candidatus Omnitrophota bacterium]
MIPIARPYFGEEEISAVRDVISSRWVTQGPKVKEFEDGFARYTGAKYACAVSNCTVALHMALICAGVRPGDVVITVSHSFIATANSVRHCGAEPVFVDVDADTGNISVERLKRLLKEDCEVRMGQLFYKKVADLAKGQSPLAGLAGTTTAEGKIGRVAAIMPVHQAGMPCDIAAILEIAGKADIPVIEDAACALGSEVRMLGAWEKIGKPHGRIACFSFHPRKVITTGEGGMLTTDDPGDYRTLTLLRNHGMSISDLERHRSNDIIFEKYDMAGFNYRMTDIQAAIGIRQLERLPDILGRLRNLAVLYGKALEGIDGLRTPKEPSCAKANWQTYIIYLDRSFERKKVMRFLKDNGVSTRRGVMCAHRETPYADLWPEGILPNSEAAMNNGIVLPIFAEMAVKDVDLIAALLKKAIPLAKA